MHAHHGTANTCHVILQMTSADHKEAGTDAGMHPVCAGLGLEDVAHAVAVLTLARTSKATRLGSACRAKPNRVQDCILGIPARAEWHDRTWTWSWKTC